MAVLELGDLDLAVEVVAVGGRRDLADDAHGDGHLGVGAAGEQLVHVGRGAGGIVGEDQAGVGTIRVDDAQAGGRDGQPLVLVLTEEHRLAVFEIEQALVADVAVGVVGEGAVVEDVAVLQNFDEGGAVMLGGALDRRGQVLGVGVEAARDEGRLGGEGDGERIERALGRADWRGFGHLAQLGGR